jgi:hypothetical protein
MYLDPGCSPITVGSENIGELIFKLKNGVKAGIDGNGFI